MGALEVIGLTVLGCVVAWIIAMSFLSSQDRKKAEQYPELREKLIELGAPPNVSGIALEWAARNLLPGEEVEFLIWSCDITYLTNLRLGGMVMLTSGGITFYAVLNSFGQDVEQRHPWRNIVSVTSGRVSGNDNVTFTHSTASLLGPTTAVTIRPRDNRARGQMRELYARIEKKIRDNSPLIRP